MSCVLAVYRHDSYRSGTLPVARQSSPRGMRIEVWRMCVLFVCLGEAQDLLYSTTYSCKAVHGVLYRAYGPKNRYGLKLTHHCIAPDFVHRATRRAGRRDRAGGRALS